MNNINSIRKDWRLIESFISSHSRILDIGCGEGELIEQLENNIYAKTHGIEINPDLTRKAIAKGFSVVQGNAEKDLSQYANQSFDYVILSQTLQAMVRPKEVLLELLRIGGKAIVSFPNFGHWKIRLQLLLTGKMPVTESLPYAWYDTPTFIFLLSKIFKTYVLNLILSLKKVLALAQKENNLTFP